MARFLAAVVLIGVTAGLVLTGAASAAQRNSGDRRHWQGPGYVVEEVAPNSPAALAGLRSGDRIVAINVSLR